MLQFAHVAWPSVGLQGCDSADGDPGSLAPVTPGRLLDEGRRQPGDVSRPLPEWRQHDGKHIESVEQVLAKPSGSGLQPQAPVRRRNHPDVDAPRRVLAHSLELPFLQHPEELSLEFDRDLPDFVEEERAAVGGLEPSRAVAQGAGECALGMAEELAFEQFARDRCTVHANQRSMAPRTQVVQRACHELLACARFTFDEHRGGRGRDNRHLVEHRAESGAVADEAMRRAPAQLIAEVGVLQFEPLLEPLDFAERAGVRDRHGRMVGEGAEPGECLPVARLTAEHAEDAEHFAAENQRLATEAADALPPDPAGIHDPFVVSRDVFDEYAFARGPDPADLPYPRGNRLNAPSSRDQSS